MEYNILHGSLLLFKILRPEGRWKYLDMRISGIAPLRQVGFGLGRTQIPIMWTNMGKESC